jgi:O-acetyl-ADP-ribose deacetylase (regulator of RNase III)
MGLIMKIYLRDQNEAVVAAWRAFHVFVLDLSIEVGDPADAGAVGIVSPANSFGFMDGGIDLAYARRWPGLEAAVRSHIRTRTVFEELLVGQAAAVGIPGALEPTEVLIVAPTMRVPKKIADPADVYLATRAAVRCAHVLNLDSLAMPGMGTGCGVVPPAVAAQAMMRGIRHAIGAPKPESMAEASRLHWEFQRP